MVIQKSLCHWNEDEHLYQYDGIQIPSVTQIIQPISAIAYSDINPAILNQAALRGTKIHEYCECIDYGMDVGDLPIEPELVGYVQAYIRFLNDWQPEYELVEKRLFGHWNGVLFAGTLDRLAVIDGHRWLIDLKTTTSANRATKISWAVQLYGYQELLDCNSLKIDMDDIRLVDVQLKSNGTYNLHFADDTRNKYNFCLESMFVSLLNLWWTVRGKKCKKK